MQKVTLLVRTEICENQGEHEDDLVRYDGVKIIGEVKRGDEILYTKEVIANDDVESVCDAKDYVDTQIELWAVENTDFVPESEYPSFIPTESESEDYYTDFVLGAADEYRS